ncbi:hypothetical protein PMIN06_001180 [Paraphaeosphaeria minitans]
MRLDETVEELPTLSMTIIVTRTAVQWVEPSSTLKRFASQTQHPAQIDSPLASQVSGEGDLSSLELIQATRQPSNEAAASPTISPTSPSTLLEDTTQEQSPCQSDVSSCALTLYDCLAGRPTSHTAVLHDSTPYVPFSNMEGGEFELPDIPPSVQFALFACLGAGALWSVLVWLINLPLTRPKQTAQDNHNVQKRATKRHENGGKAKWWKRIWGRRHVPRQTPADSPQRYAPLASGSSTCTGPSSEGASTAATSATPERAANMPVRLRRLTTPATKRQPLCSPSLPPWQRQTPSTPVAHHQGQRNSNGNSSGGGGSTASSSPANPFLPYPLQPRSSSEYVAAHHAFFSKPLPTPPLPRSSPLLSPYPSRSTSTVSDLDALEAQSDSAVEPQRSRSTRSVMHIADGVEKTGGKLWPAGWIGAVEVGVHKAVDAVARWTEDEGGEEGLLLPLGRREG